MCDAAGDMCQAGDRGGWGETCVTSAGREEEGGGWRRRGGGGGKVEWYDGLAECMFGKYVVFMC